jgi:hypothetical protein
MSRQATVIRVIGTSPQSADRLIRDASNLASILADADAAGVIAATADGIDTRPVAGV